MQLRATSIYLILSVLVACGWNVSLADDRSTGLPADVDARIQAIEQNIVQVRDEVGAVNQRLLESRRQLSDVDRRLQPLLSELEAIEQHRHRSTETIEKQREAITKARAEQQTEEGTVAALRQEIEALQQKLAEAEKKATEAKSNAEKSEQEIQSLQKQMEERAARVEPLTLAIVEPKQAREHIAEQTAAIEREVEQLNARETEYRQAIEDELKNSGQWVSFSHHIAPIVHGRCLACHNSRTARGGYNMQSFANAMSQGESGLAIVPHQPDESWLLELIESGEMPAEADRLSDEELELFRRWIAQGARLDVSAEEKAPLVQLMPRPAMPPAPDKYPASLPVTALTIGTLEGESLLMTSGYREVLFWTLDGKLIKRMGNTLERIYALSLSHDGRWLAVASGQPGQLGDVSIFDPMSGVLKCNVLLSGDVILDLAFSPNGDRLAVAGADGRLNIYSVRTIEQDSELTLVVDKTATVADHADWVNGLAWSRDGRWLATASRDKTAKVFDSESGRSITTYAEHSSEVLDVELSANGEQVVTADVAGKQLRVWRARDGHHVRDIGLEGREPIAIRSLNDDELVVALAGGGIVKFRISNGEKLAEFAAPGGIGPGGTWPSSLLIDSSQKIWLGNQAGQVYQLDTLDGRELQSWSCKP